MASVYRIDPIAATTTGLRVCAYARVSSDSKDQLNSFASQVRYYTKYIQSHEEWSLVDIYADEGISGTCAAKRDEFQRLLRDCRLGKIDRILVKSVSRFARNAQDCLEAVRELKRLGVTVMFEKERIDTAQLSSEMMLSMMSAFAQEESISTSKNLRKGALMRMKNGKFRLSQAPYGYRLDAQGGLRIHQDEAQIVRRIYNEFLSGMSIQEIATGLKSEGVPKLRGNPVWSYTGVRYILTNERYVGDELFQKRLTTDTLPFKKKRNNGEKTQFYISDTHEPIVSREVFAMTQNLMAQKSREHGHAADQRRYPFSGVLRCGECGTNFCRRIARDGSVFWTCRRHLRDKRSCAMRSISEVEIINSFQTLYLKLQANSCDVLLTFAKQLEQLEQRQAIQRPETLQQQERISELLQQSHTLHQLRVRECIDSAFFISQTNEIERELDGLRQQLKKQRNRSETERMLYSTNQMLGMLDRPMNAFQAEVFQQMVRGVTIVQDKLQFHMMNGLNFEELREM